MHNIKNYNTFTKIEPINKGWSNDKKYYIETTDDRKLLLRVADISEYDRKKAEYAVKRLKATVPVYQDLAHINLIKFIKAEEVGDGFAVIFEWTDSECMGRMYPLSRQRYRLDHTRIIYLSEK